MKSSNTCCSECNKQTDLVFVRQVKEIAELEAKVEKNFKPAHSSSDKYSFLSSTNVDKKGSNVRITNDHDDLVIKV